MKKVLLSLIVVSFISSAAFCEQVVDKTLAIVNGEPLMSSEFEKIIEPMIQQYRVMTPIAEQSDKKVAELKKELLDQKIEQMVLLQEAKKQKIKVPKRELDAAISQVTKRFPDDAAFKKELDKEGLTQADFEKRIDEQLMAQKLIEKEMKGSIKQPTEKEIKSFYEDVSARMKGKYISGLSQEDAETVDAVAKLLTRMSSEQVRICQIYIKCDKNATQAEKTAAQKKVADVKKDLAAGMRFEDLAEKCSDDALLRQRRGDMGFIVRGDLDKRLEDKAFTLNVGQYTKEPIKTDSGYHFLRVKESRASTVFTYDDVKNDLAEVLYRQNGKKQYDKWVAKLKSKATIKINN